MIETQSLSKQYGSFQALRDLSIKVEAGEIFCLLGANGAGKSTTISLLLNFLQPSQGRALIDGIDVTREPLRSKQSLSYIPENLMLYPKLTGLENLDFFCQLSGKRFSEKTLRDLMAQVGIDPGFIDQRVHTYSKGMRQKVGIALTRAKEAKVLLLDEPTSGLDPQASNEFAGLLQEMKERGVAILMATHDLFRARETATHIGIMKRGQLVDHLDRKAIDGADLERLYLSHMN
jgi:ABC-2 type transport system ATP-binding protein